VCVAETDGSRVGRDVTISRLPTLRGESQTSELLYSVACRLLVSSLHRDCSRSLKMAPFDRPYTTFYWSAIVHLALSGSVFELFDVE